jgi:hypothetical protein
MLLGYVDDSGERGLFLLAAVIVKDDSWLRTLDAWIDYRRWLRQEFGYRFTKDGGRKPIEVHATEFISGAGEWRRLAVAQPARMRAMRVGLRLIGRQTRVFAVAWDPNRIGGGNPPPGGIPHACWEVMLERFATHSNYEHGSDRIAFYVDAGYEVQFRRAVRKMRRYHRVGSVYGGSLQASAPMFVDDPSVRDSIQSAYIQMADLAAYAALRELRPTPISAGLWAELGTGVVRAVNRMTRGQPPGIKLLPLEQ